MTESRLPWHAYALLLQPKRIRRHLQLIEAAGALERTPNLWQLSLGVLRMWHRILFRSETIGTCTQHAVRDNWRARLLAWRPLRFPFLLAARAVHPLDLTGLASTPDDLINHLIGAHHDKNQFIFDLEILACYPGELERLQGIVHELTSRDDRRSRWLRDLAVFESYHENLRDAVDAVVARGIELSEADAADPDLSFRGYMAWCAAQPATPEETIAAWRRGEFRLGPRASAGQASPVHELGPRGKSTLVYPPVMGGRNGTSAHTNATPTTGGASA